MWKIKTFKTKEKMEQFIKANKDKMQYNEVFINNGYAIEYKRLLRVY